ncbi:API5 [Cordylochernes scorpioides]|nr:API5 [Cordylochernes scorpioides]
MDNIDKLYNIYEKLSNAKEKILEYESDYIEILNAVKGSIQEKKLASQFISCFFKDFPHLADRALDAHLDLCEDGDSTIRKQAIKNLPNFCKNNKGFLPRIADALTQLLQIDASSEQLIVHNALMEL